MNDRILRARLVAIVGEHEAQDLLESPNSALGGRSPQDLLGERNFAPVEMLIKGMELQATSRRDFLQPILHDDLDEIDWEVEGAEHRLRQRSEKGTSAVLKILDALAVERLRSLNFEEKGSE